MVESFPDLSCKLAKAGIDFLQRSLIRDCFLDYTIHPSQQFSCQITLPGAKAFTVDYEEAEALHMPRTAV